MNQEDFDRSFGRVSKDTEHDSKERQNSRKILAFTGAKNDDKRFSVGSMLIGWVPILGWLPRYDFKKHLFNDIIGGVTVGIMHVPQGMAYASLAGLKPVNGLYTSLFPPLIYMVFGTSRHISLGVFAVVSLMVGSCNLRVTELLVNQMHNGSSANVPFNLENEEYLAISTSIVTSLALLVGFIQIAMALLRLDFLTDYLSLQVIEGFTTGAAVHVFSAQLNKILGVSLPRSNSFPKLFWIYKDLANSIIAGQGNGITFIISTITLILLYSAKNLFNPMIKDKCRFPIPYDLFVMIFGAILSQAIDLNGKYEVKIIGPIPTGLPFPSIPNVSLFHYFISDAIAIAVVVLVTTVSMGKLMAAKHAYEIDVRQEFYAIGFMETICSLLPCWPSSTALARTLVYEMAGTKTQLATIFSSILLLSVIYYIGPFISVLPTCFLSCIIIVALKGMFMQLTKIPILWRCSKSDCVIFVVTFLSTVIFDVVPGLMIGVIVAVLSVLHRMQKAKLVELGEIFDEEKNLLYQPYFEPIEEFSQIRRSENVKILQFGSPLMFLNAEFFKRQMMKKVEEIVDVVHSNSDTLFDKSNNHCLLEVEKSNSGNSIKMSLSPKPTIILDMKRITSIDYTGAKILHEIHTILKKKNISLLLVEADRQVISTLKKFCSIEEFSKIYQNLYPSISDAIQGNSTK